MKKTVLLALAVGYFFAADAQSQTSKVGRAPGLKAPSTFSPSAENRAQNPLLVKNAKKAVRHNTSRVQQTLATTKIKFATAGNLFSALTAGCTQVTYNTTLSMIAFTHRECMSYPYGIGAYETDYSTDGGATWDTTHAIVNKGLATRYPNGVILNPKGNSTPAMAYAVSSGPHVTGSAWDSVASSSVRLDGANPNINEVVMYPNNNTSSALNVFSPPHYLTVCDDSTVHSIEYAWSFNSALTQYYGFYGAVINTGTWSSATHSLTWNSQVIRPTLASYSGPSFTNDTEAQVSEALSAWSQDGSVGYVVFFGNLDSTGYNYASEQPIVYKSIDHGATWNMMPMYNFKNIPSLVQYLRPTIDSGYALPFWDIAGDSGYYSGHDVDATVDSNYNLHIFGAIEPAAIANPDSGGYTFNPAFSGKRYVYDVYTTTATGGWKALLIDSLTSTFGSYITETNWSAGNITFGSRIQASRNITGGQVFCTWNDDFVTGNNTIANPDIMTAEIDVTKQKVVAGPTQTTNDANNFFMNVSDIAFYNGGCWNIPAVVVIDPSVPDDGTKPVEFDYVQGICPLVSGVNEINSKGAADFAVSANYPNPFNKLTQFDVTLTEEATVSVDVYNLVGQKVLSVSPEKMAPGKHIMSINGAGLNAGIYFYRVTANGQSITHKMVIE